MNKPNICSIILFIITALIISGCATSGNSYVRKGGIGGLFLGVNAKDKRLVEAVYLLKITDVKNKNEIPPMQLMLFFAAELTRENKYDNFVLLPRNELPNKRTPAKNIESLKIKVLSGKYNDYMKRPSIFVTNMKRCRDFSCVDFYVSRSVIVMLKSNEAKKIRSFVADKVYAKYKPLMPSHNNKKQTN